MFFNLLLHVDRQQYKYLKYEVTQIEIDLNEYHNNSK